MALEITKPVVVLGEGRDEEEIFGVAFADKGLQIVAYSGKANLKEYLATLPKLSGFDALRRLVVTRDADDSEARAFQSACGALAAAGLAVPFKPGEAAPGAPEVVVVILPGRGSQGALEDLCLESLATDPALRCVDEYFGCLSSRAEYERQPWRMGKARMQAWLAARDRPGSRLGEYVRSEPAFPFDRSVFSELLRAIEG